jgi:hypothetical protein
LSRRTSRSDRVPSAWSSEGGIDGFGRVYSVTRLARGVVHCSLLLAASYEGGHVLRAQFGCTTQPENIRFRQMNDHNCLQQSPTWLTSHSVGQEILCILFDTNVE